MRRIALIGWLGLMAAAGSGGAPLGAMGPMDEAQEWTALDGAEIAAALTGQVLDYETAWQSFRASGRTLYHAGQDSWGYWQVQGARYCSQWPPNALWSCYDVARRGPQIRFTGDFEDVSIGVLRR